MMQEKVPAHERRARSKMHLQLANRTTGSTKTLAYPKKCLAGSARPLAQLFRVMDLAHEAIVEDIPMTKRDIYYNDVQLFKSQKTVDTLVDDLAATFDLDRSSLNIRASSKGLICGSGLTIYLTSGETVRPTDTKATLIPAGEDIFSFGLSEDVRWVLIIEKEAVFQTLCNLEITNSHDFPGRGLLITGKGYPDIATRHLVKTLADCLPPSIPIMALVDGDPYGLDILSVYKYGSRALKHENERLAAGDRVVWIGIWASEFSSLGIDKDKLLPISKGDEKKANSLLLQRKELMRLLFVRRKAEIEILSSIDNDLSQDINSDATESTRNTFQEQSVVRIMMDANTDDQMEESCCAADISNTRGVMDNEEGCKKQDKTGTTRGGPSGIQIIP
ncbi:hypothetical protein AGABI2DRAFT_212660 [Agaricus bisporus var. bisporus H97]|uniref:hypothetical protein n=1 Tax=Agaricus bisporus var. bisporus (strain H97 / ATCC MYA-4626 / FGSC 10389) TaxID=936046 RepID=UPI00029F6F0B|nr:hypothetical protein AGABI2DRAFT_212660 [Agaricus bisporus var. bisporus H97]EKV42071.1 hypothetical protein AGABI2DRAFT_212660 [Agaricus bisporus var. bisporus H97]